jgi:hypothetical protein
MTSNYCTRGSRERVKEARIAPYDNFRVFLKPDTNKDATSVHFASSRDNLAPSLPRDAWFKRFLLEDEVAVRVYTMKQRQEEALAQDRDEWLRATAALHDHMRRPAARELEYFADDTLDARRKWGLEIGLETNILEPRAALQRPGLLRDTNDRAYKYNKRGDFGDFDSAYNEMLQNKDVTTADLKYINSANNVSFKSIMSRLGDVNGIEMGVLPTRETKNNEVKEGLSEHLF